MQHIVILSSLCKWKRPKWLFFVVKRYAVREAKKWRYAVRKAKIGRYAVRKGGGGVTLTTIYLESTRNYLKTDIATKQLGHVGCA